MVWFGGFVALLLFVFFDNKKGFQITVDNNYNFGALYKYLLYDVLGGEL